MAKSISRHLRKPLKSKGTIANSTADRAIEILLAFTEMHPVWTATDLSEYFGMPRSTVYRYVNSLRSYGLIVGDEKGGFRLSSKIVALAWVAGSAATIARVAKPFIEDLSERFGELVSITERVGFDLVPIVRIECKHHVRINFMRSSILPWPATAAAKLMLAYAPAEELEAMFDQFAPHSYTPNTVIDKKKLMAEFKRIRGRGYSLSDGERDDGVCGIAAPVFIDEKVRYCMVVGGPAFRFVGRRLEELTEAVCEAAAKISREFECYQLLPHPTKEGQH